MLIRGLFIFSLLTSCSARENHSAPNPDAVNQLNDTLQPPNIAALRQRLFDYFDRHRHLDSFDTADNTYSSYFGPVQFAPYTATAGHLLNGRQIHAMIFYVDEEGQGLKFYLKEHGKWLKISDDTSFAYLSGMSYPTLQDWNGDGIKDLIIAQYTMMDKIAHHELWLTDRSGRKLHHVEDFVEVPNPELDSATGDIRSFRYTAGNLHLAKYRFKGYELYDIYDVHIADVSHEFKAPDSAIVINYRENQKPYKEIWCAENDVFKHVPKEIHAEVKGWYGPE